ncbi:MAG: hypothetical protein R3F59_34210 [Myxococcota bacterium]
MDSLTLSGSHYLYRDGAASALPVRVSLGSRMRGFVDGEGSLSLAALGNAPESQVPRAAFVEGTEDFDVGDDHSCWIIDGRAGCVGASAPWRAPEPSAVPPAEPLHGLSAAASACALDDDGAIRCWGAAADPVLAYVPEGAGFVAVAVGDGAACAIDDVSDVWCWGDPDHPVLTAAR